jgi:hypothetical protein
MGFVKLAAIAIWLKLLIRHYDLASKEIVLFVVVPAKAGTACCDVARFRGHDQPVAIEGSLLYFDSVKN